MKWRASIVAVALLVQAFGPVGACACEHPAELSTPTPEPVHACCRAAAAQARKVARPASVERAQGPERCTNCHCATPTLSLADDWQGAGMLASTLVASRPAATLPAALVAPWRLVAVTAPRAAWSLPPPRAAKASWPAFAQVWRC